MDFHIWFGTAHRRLTRPAHSSCPYPGDEWRKLPPRHQQEGTTAIGSGAKPNPKDTKRRRPRHQNMNRHGSTKINRRFIAPFLLTRSVHFLAAIWHNLSPPLTIPCDVRVFPLLVKRQSKAWPESEQRVAQWLEPTVALSLVEEESLRSLIFSFMERLAANAKIRQKR